MNREDQLAAIVTEYFQAKERGESPNSEALLVANPELADDLRSFFAAQSQVAKAADSLKAAYDPNLVTVGAEAGTSSPTFVKYFGDYELLQEIARGGMGVVYKARQVSLNRTVALKMILAGQLASIADIQRFRQEAESAANLDHPNILPIHEVGEHQGQQYFSMKMVNGGNLAAKLPELRKDLKSAIGLFIAVCEGVSFAHQRGILHRDLKPANILIDADGTPYVTDFGLAKKVEGDSGITQSGAVVGTPSYMAPEQAQAVKNVSTAVDTYSLGAMLYELVAGQPPFRGETVYETLQKVVEEQPVDPRSLNRDANRDLSVIALKCLGKDPAKRYPTVAALIDDLGRCRRGEPIAARPVGRVERLKMWGRRNPKLAASLAGIYLALLGGVIALNYGLRMSQRSVDATQKLYEQSQDQERDAIRLGAVVSESLGAEKQTAYFTRVNLALNEWQLNNPARADRLLDDGEAALRGWEWGFLRRMMHAERAAITPDSRGLAALTYSPDGKWLITAGVDTRIRLWDPASGKHFNTLNGHTNLVRSVTFSPDGKQLISCSAKETLAWSLETGKPVPWTGPTTGAKYIEVNALGQVAQLLKDKQVAVFAAGSNKPLFTVPGEFAAWEPQGKFLATTFGNNVFLRDPKTGAEQSKLTTDGKPLSSVAISGNGQRLTAGSENRQYAWDVPSRRLILDQKSRGFDAVLTRDGKRLAVGGQREVRFWDLDTGDELPRLRGLSGFILNLAFSPDGRSFAAATGDMIVSALKKDDPDSLAASFILAFVGEAMDKQAVDLRIWDAPLPEFGTALTSDDRPVKTFAVGPKGLLAVGRDKEIELWSIPERRVLKSIPVEDGNADCLAISPDGATLLSGGKGKEVQVWDTAKGTARPQRIKMNKEISTLSTFPDGQTVAIAAGNGNSVVVWDYQKGEERSVSFAESSGSSHVAIGHQSPLLIRSSSGGVSITNDDSKRSAGRAFVIDTMTGLKLRELDATSGIVRALALSHDDRLAATISGNKLAAASMQIFDVATGKEFAHYLGDSEIPSALAFTPDGRRLAISTDASLKFWDIASGKLILTIPGAVGRLQFTPEGTSLIVQRENGIAIFETTAPPQSQPLPPETNVQGDPPLPTEASPDPFPESIREILSKAEGRVDRKDLAGAMLFTLRAAEADSDPSRADCYRRALGLYREALPRIGDSIPSAAKTPLTPEKPLDQQCHNCFGANGATILFYQRGESTKPFGIRRFDLRTGQELGGKIPVEGSFHYDAFEPVVPTRDGKQLIVQPSRMDNQTIKRWIESFNLESGKFSGSRIELPAFASEREVHGRKVLSVTGDGKYAVLDLILQPNSANNDSDEVPERTMAWELTTGTKLTLPTRFHRLAFSPDGRYVLALWTKSLEPTLPELPNVVYDLATMQPVGQPILLPPINDHLVLSRDGKFIVATDGSSHVTLRVFEVATGRCTLARRVNNNRLHFGLSPQGDRIVLPRESYKGKNVIEIRETATGKLTQTGTTIADSPNRMQFSPDGRFILVSLWGGQRQLIDTSLTEPIGPPIPCDSSGHDGEWSTDGDAVFASDGNTLLTRAPWPKDKYLSQTQFYLWNLKPEAVNLVEEMSRTELLAGRVINSTGELVPISLDDYRRRWKEANAAHPDWFADNAPNEPLAVPTAPRIEGQGPDHPPRPELKPDYAPIFARHGGAEKPPLVSIADALQGPSQTNRVAAFDYLAFTRPDERLTLELLAEGLKDATIRSEIENRFEQLGNKATPAVALLVEELTKQWNHEKPSKALIRALGKIGPPAKDSVPVLREYLASIGKNFHSDVESEAIRTLGRIGPQAKPALAELIEKVPKFHTDEAKSLFILAVERIAVGQEHDLLPLLSKILEAPVEKDSSRRRTSREACCEFIAHFGPKLQGIEPALRKVLAEPLPKRPDANHFERVAALEALWRVTGKVEEVLPLLETELKRQYFGWHTIGVTANGHAAAVLGRIGEPAKKFVPALEAVLKNPHTLQDRIEVAEAIWRSSGKPEAFVAASRAMFDEKTQYGSVDDDKIRVIGTLSAIGPAAKEIVPSLLALAKAEADKEASQAGFRFTYIRQDDEDPDPNLKGKYLPAVREALRKIDPKALETLDASLKK